MPLLDVSTKNARQLRQFTRGKRYWVEIQNQTVGQIFIATSEADAQAKQGRTLDPNQFWAPPYPVSGDLWVFAPNSPGHVWYAIWPLC